MKNYTITVNGNVYDVTVEEGASTGAPVAAPKAAAPAPAAAPKADAIITVTDIIMANVGDKVTKGQVIFVLEAMKMENDIVAPQDGTIASIDTAAGNSVESGETLATLN